MAVTAVDFYLIDIPEDIEEPEERARLALLAAEDQAQVYAVPSTWTVLNDDGERVIVKRERNGESGLNDDGAYKTLIIGQGEGMKEWLEAIRKRNRGGA